MTQPNRKPTPTELEQMQTELKTTDSEGLPSNVVSESMYCVPLTYEPFLMGDDTMDGGEFRIPIELVSGSPAIVTLTPNPTQNTLTIKVLRSISTTPSD